MITRNYSSALGRLFSCLNLIAILITASAASAATEPEVAPLSEADKAIARVLRENKALDESIVGKAIAQTSGRPASQQTDFPNHTIHVANQIKRIQALADSQMESSSSEPSGFDAPIYKGSSQLPTPR